MPYLLCGTYQVELPEVKVASGWGRTLMPYLLCGTYQVELPEVQVALSEEVQYCLTFLWHLPNIIARSEGCLEWGN